MANVELQSILTKIREANQYANMDLEGWDYRTLPGMQIKKAEAKNQLDTLKDNYKRLVKNVLAKVFVVGSRANAEKFADLAEDEGALSVQGDLLYQKLSEPLDKELGNQARLFSANQTIVLQDALFETFKTFNISSIPSPHFPADKMGVRVADLNAIKEIVKDSVRRVAGDDLTLLYLERQVVDAAYDSYADQTIVPVVIYGLSREEVGTVSSRLFMGRPNIVVDVDVESPDQNLVVKVSRRILEAVNPVAVENNEAQ